MLHAAAEGAPAKIIEATAKSVVQAAWRLVIGAAAALQELVAHLGGEIVEGQPVVARPLHAAQRIARHVAVAAAGHAGRAPHGVGLRAVVKARVAAEGVRSDGGGRQRQLPADARAGVGRRQLRLGAVRVARLAMQPAVAARRGLAGRAAKGVGVGASRRVDVRLQRVEDRLDHPVLLRVARRAVVLLHQQLRSGERGRGRWG